MSQDVEEAKVLYERFFRVVGLTVDRIVDEAEAAAGEPFHLAPMRHIRTIGRMAILARLLDGALLPLELISFFFDDEPPVGSPPPFDLAAPGPETCSPEFHAELRKIAGYLAARLGLPVAAEPVPAA